jgi:hypothetical protein
MRIALGAVLVFAALWFVALRPKPVEEVASDPVPAVETPAATPSKSSGTSGSGSAAQSSDAATPAAEKPAATKKKQAAPEASSGGAGAEAVLADLAAGRTVVLLVWDGKSADDRSVRRAVSRVDRHGGKVRTHVARVSKLSSYEAITKGVPITESPTVLVIDTKRQARVISGLTVKAEIDDAVDRALAVK